MTPVSDIPRLPPRKPDTHKGDYGRVLVVGGCVGMAGAPCLAANAAYRAGAGLVRLAVPAPIQSVVSTLVPCATNTALPACDDGRILGGRAALAQLIELAALNDVLVIGPGLGRDQHLDALVRDLLAAIDKPAVVDADGVRALAPADRIDPPVAARLVLTPHAGEFGFLTGRTAEQVQCDRQAAAAAFTASFAGVLVLKGRRTIVADRERRYVNQTGNPGMATGGAGDVLAGVIAAFIGQGMSLFDAAVAGVYVHGAAGDLAAAELGEASLTATDLLDYLPGAVRGIGEPGFAGFAPRRSRPADAGGKGRG
jgi:NAD(P)H-hydrate epimerase